MQKHNGLSVWRAALLVIKLVYIRDSDVSAVVGFDFRVQSSKVFHVFLPLVANLTSPQKDAHAI